MTDMNTSMAEKELVWVGSSQRDLRGFPHAVKKVFGYALRLAQRGQRHPDTKILSGFHGAKTLEVVEDFQGSAYRTIYTVEFAARVYVLHCFQKKSKKGAATPKSDMDLVRVRLRDAARLHNDWLKASQQN